MNGAKALIRPDDIRGLWRRQGLIDPFAWEPQAQDILANPGDEAPVIAGAVTHGHLIARELPGFFEAFDYGWALDPASFTRGRDAVFQMRALQQLSCANAWPLRPPQWDLSGIVVGSTFAFRASDMTPLVRRDGALRLIVFPYAFNVLASLLIRAFCQWAGDEGSDWRVLEPTDALEPSKSAPATARQAVADYLTASDFDRFHDEGHPALALGAAAPWFAPATGNLLEPDASEVERVLAYAAFDFALSHELGHAVCGHAGAVMGPAALEREIEADGAALNLFARSWGWRDEILDPCPLSSAARNVLGPVIFVWLGEWISMLSSAAEARFSDRIPVEQRELWRRDTKARVDDQERRNAAIMGLVGGYPDHMRSLGADFPTEHEQALHNLIKNAARFNAALGGWIMAIDQVEVDAVLSLARR